MSTSALPFIVVMTLKSPSSACKILHVFTVPRPWLLSKNTLAYPPFSASVIESQARMGFRSLKPEANWKKFAYVVKKKFQTYEDAQSYVSQNAEVSSDHDNHNLELLHRIQLSLAPPKKTSE